MTSLVKKFYGKWRESVFELNEENRTLFLFYVKNGLDRIIESHVPNFSSYEDMRFQIRELNDILCVHAQCNNCHSDFYVSLHVIKYLDGMLLDSELLPSIICESCNVANLSIGRLYDK